VFLFSTAKLMSIEEDSMSVGHVPDRPSFRMQEIDSQELEVAPISPLAIVTLLLGIVSLLSIISPQLVVLSIFALLAGLIVVVLLLRDRKVAGIVLAQIGLGLGVLSTAWAVSSTSIRDAHLYQEAEKNAKVFLQLLSEGDTYRSFELKLEENDRQIAGTNLNLYYEQLLNSAPVPVNIRAGSVEKDMPSAQSMRDGQMQTAFQEFIAESSTGEILSHGKSAKWELARRGGVASPASHLHRIKVIMVDMQKPERNINVQLLRTARSKKGFAPAASWQVESVTLEKS
jgi:hypothetical protein